MTSAESTAKSTTTLGPTKSHPTHPALIVLREFVLDIEAMQCPNPEWFGPFECGENDVRWPNLKILLDKAKALLQKEGNDHGF